MGKVGEKELTSNKPNMNKLFFLSYSQIAMVSLNSSAEFSRHCHCTV